MRTTKNLCTLLLRALFFLCTTITAYAGGPRWYTGAPYFTASAGQPVPFYTPDVQYFTDPGDLNAHVTHAQADVMVAAAAAVWNVPLARLTLTQGGALAEHLSAANAYFDGTSLILPADAQPSNFRAKPIAIAYDTDGSLIDTLLGAGASGPAGCKQTAVVGDVDALDPDGTIHHALLILNGRCVGANADQLTQMQYQLTRAFGRVLGLAWSQLNDNVFTGTPTPTLAEELAWPLMHPIDVVCGPYTFKCMASPFTLREDDISALAGLYPVTAANMIAGKVLSSSGAATAYGLLNFPTGQGMDAVNIVVRRQQPFTAVDPALLVSAVTGVAHQQFRGNPVTGPPSGAAESQGAPRENNGGVFSMPRIPVVSLYNWDEFDFWSEPINPLYQGDYAIGTYVGAPPVASGSGVAWHDPLENPGAHIYWYPFATDAAGVCAPGNDGTETAPSAFDATGFFSGQLCSSGHSSWFSFSAKAGRTWTLETTALDESSAATVAKARPAAGAWLASDATGTLPTVNAIAAAFNSIARGVTLLRFDAATTAQNLRLVIADERGIGRPDFSYKARILYADSVTPMQLSAPGGTITISGRGFRSGNRVTVNGVAATVISWTSNMIVATAPTMSAAHMNATGAGDVAVLDAGTGASTSIKAALTYSAAAVYTATTAAAPRYLAAGGASAWTASIATTLNGTSTAGLPVNWTATTGIALAAASTLTDASGAASVGVSTAGLVGGAQATITGCVASGVCASSVVNGVASSQWTVGVGSGAGQSVHASQTLAPVTLLVSDAAAHPLEAAAVQVFQTVDAWEGACPVSGRCPAAPVLATTNTTATSDASGHIAVTPLELPGVASTIHIAAASGTQGFVALTLVKTP